MFISENTQCHFPVIGISSGCSVVCKEKIAFRYILNIDKVSLGICFNLFRPTEEDISCTRRGTRNGYRIINSYGFILLNKRIVACFVVVVPIDMRFSSFFCATIVRTKLYSIRSRFYRCSVIFVLDIMYPCIIIVYCKPISGEDMLIRVYISSVVLVPILNHPILEGHLSFAFTSFRCCRCRTCNSLCLIRIQIRILRRIVTYNFIAFIIFSCCGIHNCDTISTFENLTPGSI